MDREDFRKNLQAQGLEIKQSEETPVDVSPNIKEQTLNGLNAFLFNELERLNDTQKLATDEELEKEIKRSKAITNVAQTIINNANTVLAAQKFLTEKNIEKLPKMLIEND